MKAIRALPLKIQLVISLLLLGCSADMAAEAEPPSLLDAHNEEAKDEIDAYLSQYDEVTIVTYWGDIDGTIQCAVFSYYTEQNIRIKRSYCIGQGELSIREAEDYLGERYYSGLINHRRML